MDSPEDNEEYKLEYHVFPTVEQELEKYQSCKQARAEWDEKSRVYENYKQEQEEKEIDKLLEEEYMEDTGHLEEDRVILPEDVWTLPMNSQKTRYHSY